MNRAFVVMWLAAMTALISTPGCGKQEAAKPVAEAPKKDGAAPPAIVPADNAPPKLPTEVPPLVIPPLLETKPALPAKTPTVKKERSKATETIALTAEAFGGEIGKGADAAAKKFEPVFVELSGTVRHVGSRDQEAYVSLDAGPESLAILCVLAQEKEPWAKISKGQKIKVRGRWPQTFIQPALEECTLVDMGPNPAVVLTAETLADEFAKNKDATRTKYQEKPVALTGLIVHADTNELGAVRLFLKGAGEVRVDCGFNASDRADATSQLVGQRVRLVGEFSALESADAPALRGCRVITVK